MRSLLRILISSLTLGHFFSSICFGSGFREVVTSAGIRIKIDQETHRVYVQVFLESTRSSSPSEPSQPQPSTKGEYWISSDQKIYAHPEFNHPIEIGNQPLFDPHPMPQSRVPHPKVAPPSGHQPLQPPPFHLGRTPSPPTYQPSLDMAAPPPPPSLWEKLPKITLSSDQIANLAHAAHELFGPGIPLRDYSAISEAAAQSAALAKKISAELNESKTPQTPSHALPSFQPSEEQIRRHQDQQIIDVPSIEDPMETELPYQVQYQGPERAELIRLYQHLYKITPETTKRKNARDLGLISIQYADSHYMDDEIAEGHYWKELAEGFLDIAIGIDPVTGFARSTYELVTGRNLITGARLETSDQIINAVNILTLGTDGSLKASVKSIEKILQQGFHFIRSKELTLQALRTAEKVVGLAQRIGLKSPREATRFYLISKQIMRADTDGLKNLERIVQASESVSPRFGDRFVQQLPALEKTFKEAFDGSILQGVMEPGDILVQAQRTGQTSPGHWFLPIKPLDATHAEELAQIKKWGNDAGQIKVYRVNERTSAYAGKVAGGEGHQLFIPENVPIHEVIEEVIF